MAVDPREGRLERPPLIAFWKLGASCILPYLVFVVIAGDLMRKSEAEMFLSLLRLLRSVAVTTCLPFNTKQVTFFTELPFPLLVTWQW